MFPYVNGYRSIRDLQIDLGKQKFNQRNTFVDETLLKVNGQAYYWLWIAYEPNTKYA